MNPPRIFVYGTLKTGQVRADQWPITPLSIRPAWTFGTLYDTGPFPAMVAGSDRVIGELWTFEASDLPAVLAVLDVIEGTNQPGEPNEYDRNEVTCHLLDGSESVEAHAYLFAMTELLKRFRYIEPRVSIFDNMYAIWPPHDSLS